MQADRAEGNEGRGVKIARITATHRVTSFCLCVDSLSIKPIAQDLITLGGGLKSCLGFLPPFVLDAPGRVGNLLAADLHRSIGISATPPSLWPGRELRKYHCLEVPEGCLFTFQGPPASGLSSPLGEALAVTL